jgi:hypothetical protein
MEKGGGWDKQDEFAKHYTENQFLSTIRNKERASYNGSIEASQASDVGSIPIARSRFLDDSVVLTPLTTLSRAIKQGVFD